MQTTDSVRSVKGVGEKAEQNLHKLKIETVGELLEHYPRNYDEIKPVCPIEALEEGDIAAVEGVLMARPQIMKRGSKSILTITLRDTTGSLLITWFNMPFLRNQLKMGTRYLFRGKVEKRNGRLQMVQPKRYTRQEFYKIVGKMQPIYPLTAGITNHAMAKLMQEAIMAVEDFKEFLPDYKNLDELKEHYQRGGLGDVKVKKFLNNVLQKQLEPIRQRRHEYEKDIPEVYHILQEGTKVAFAEAQQTLNEVKAAMKINYFDDAELIKVQSEKYSRAD